MTSDVFPISTFSSIQSPSTRPKRDTKSGPIHSDSLTSRRGDPGPNMMTTSRGTRERRTLFVSTQPNVPSPHHTDSSIHPSSKKSSPLTPDRSSRVLSRPFCKTLRWCPFPISRVILCSCFVLILIVTPITTAQTNEVSFVNVFPQENAKAHRTSAYDIARSSNNPAVVIRRGDPFYIALQMRHPYDPVRDKIRLEFMYGPRPLLGKKTLIYLPVTGNKEFTKDSSRWDARTHRIDHGNLITVQVHVPASVAVGVWRLRVSTKQQGSRVIKSFDVRERMYILFNAWCKEDPVYMDNEDRRREYVLNDIGKIYIGSHSKPKGRKWIYGQFVDNVLPAVMFMLDKTRLDYAARSNPVKVVRAVAAMVNSHDDNGVLVGNWSGSYESGTPPWQWTGSAPIMDQYLKTSGEPVKFGQCWVFAGVTTTVSKALGIPARTVTNFVSAHDTDDSLTVDKFFDKAGETISDVNSDSIWNFHVWTDVWMSRFDLPPGYSGWQVIDSTPQETSDGLYRTGPASVESIRRGEIGLTYDSPFVFSEVNADVVHWELDEKSEFGWKKIKTNKFHVGRKLFTKRIGFFDDSPGGLGDAEDITHQYKNREGTDDERNAVLNAAKKSGLSFLFELPFTSATSARIRTRA